MPNFSYCPYGLAIRCLLSTHSTFPYPSNFSTDICGDGFQISRYGESLKYLLSVLRSDILLALLLLLVEHQPLLLLLLDGLLSQTLLVGTFLISICTVIGIFLISSFTLIGIFLISICTVTGIFLISIFAPGWHISDHHLCCHWGISRRYKYLHCHDTFTGLTTKTAKKVPFEA